MKLKVTVCELRDDPAGLAEGWEQLKAHVRAEAGDVVLLPEMPFTAWFARSLPFDPQVWQAAVAAHDEWQARLAELAPAVVLGARPVQYGAQRLNEGFLWSAAEGYRAAHHKYYLPDEAGYWEASWYERGDGSFSPVTAGGVSIGFLICTELWFLERARAYGRQGIHLLVNPRTTGWESVDKWLAGGRAAAVVSGAYTLSSNRLSPPGEKEFGGQGYIVDPDGGVLGVTSRERPFVTVEIDTLQAEAAKKTYPRYVRE